jgi:hypothetical protein
MINAAANAYRLRNLYLNGNRRRRRYSRRHWKRVGGC